MKLKSFLGLGTIIVAIWVLAALFMVSALTVGIYVAYHFISKVWWDSYLESLKVTYWQSELSCYNFLRQTGVMATFSHHLAVVGLENDRGSTSQVTQGTGQKPVVSGSNPESDNPWTVYRWQGYREPRKLGNTRERVWNDLLSVYKDHSTLGIGVKGLLTCSSALFASKS